MPLKIAVYTAIFGQYDHLLPPANINRESDNEIDYFCFTDDRSARFDVYKPVYFSRKYRNNVLNNRFLKIFIPPSLNRYDYVIYHDGSLRIDHSRIREAVAFLKDGVMATFLHPERSCVYDELAAGIKYKKENTLRFLLYAVVLWLRNFPANAGLNENTLLVRKPERYNSSRLKDFWWFDVRYLIKRDQVSLKHALDKSHESVDILPGCRVENPFSEYTPHIFQTMEEEVSPLRKKMPAWLIRSFDRLKKEWLRLLYRIIGKIKYIQSRRGKSAMAPAD